MPIHKTLKTLGQQPAKLHRVERIQKSPHFREGTFHNLTPTPMGLQGTSTPQLFFDFFFKPKPPGMKPQIPIPTIKTDLFQLPKDQTSLIWFGHSSYFIQHHEKTILVDPVFSGHASPFSSVVKAFPGTDIFSFKDFPQIDLLLITHDHYDHMDFQTVMQFKNQVNQVVLPLGAGEHLESWGYDPQKISELDWWESFELSKDIRMTAVPTRHFSGRSFKRNTSLWAAYALTLGALKVFIGGDSGYDDQFKKTGEQLGPFDLAILECGQYNEKWPYIHMFPEQTAQAAVDLKAKTLFPVHWGKFILSEHTWTESIERVTQKASELNLKITTPLIGETMNLSGHSLPSRQWWK